MLPKSKLGRQMATKLKVYKGADHPHHAQQPTALECNAPVADGRHRSRCTGIRPKHSFDGTEIAIGALAPRQHSRGFKWQI